MDKKSFIIYKEWATLITNLSDENAGQLIKAMCNHVSGAPVEITEPVISAIYSMIAGQLDKDGEKYRAKCERIAEVNKKRRSDNVTKSSRSRHDIVGDNDNDNDNDNDKKKNIYTRAKYGEYKHVLLSADELAKLNAEYGEEKTQRAIAYLDEYIEYKGAKYKNHYLVMRKWVYKALDEHKEEKPKNKFNNFEERIYDFAALEAELRGEK